ncbi:MAG: peptidylprolyl isomerase [Steroidobacteraceae bacterium]
MQFRRILREPLLHFLLLGLGLFAYYGRVAPDDDGKRRIVVTQAEVDLLATQFQGTWSRPPDPVELHGLVDSYVRDEILYREGVALGLDRDDAVIKRRVRQKLDVLFEESVAQNSATDADLQAYLDANPAAFRKPAVVSFDQIYFGSDAVTPQRLEQARAALARGADPETFGQATLLPSHQDAMPLDLIARDFGEKFAAALAKTTVGEWSGPVTSGFGTHLVRVSAIEPAQLPTLADVREVVAREWENERRKQAHADALAKLREQYEIEIQAALPSVPSP